MQQKRKSEISDYFKLITLDRSFDKMFRNWTQKKWNLKIIQTKDLANKTMLLLLEKNEQGTVFPLSK